MSTVVTVDLGQKLRNIPCYGLALTCCSKMLCGVEFCSDDGVDRICRDTVVDSIPIAHRMTWLYEYMDGLIRRRHTVAYLTIPLQSLALDSGYKWVVPFGTIHLMNHAITLSSSGRMGLQQRLDSLSLHLNAGYFPRLKDCNGDAVLKVVHHTTPIDVLAWEIVEVPL